MNITSYLLGVVAALVTLGIVIEMLRRRRLRERHAIWWLFAGIVALIVGVFPSILVWAASVVGVEIPTNLVFFASIAILFLVCLQNSSELTDLENKIRTLAEGQALQRVRIENLFGTLRELEARHRHTDGSNDRPEKRSTTEPGE